MENEQTEVEKQNLIKEYATICVNTLKEKGTHVDRGTFCDRAKEIRLVLGMKHKTICCLASTLMI